MIKYAKTENAAKYDGSQELREVAQTTFFSKGGVTPQLSRELHIFYSFRFFKEVVPGNFVEHRYTRPAIRIIELL